MGTINQYNETELLDLLQKGDVEAFDIIYKKYVISMLNIAYKRLGDKAVSEDLVQNVFLRLWNKRESVQVENLSAYLKTSIRYEILNYITRHKKLFAYQEPFDLMLAAVENAEDNVLSKDILKLIYMFADTLPPKRREVFLLHIRSGYSTNEIAGQMNISQKTVQKHLKLALKLFKTQIMPAIITLFTTVI